MGILFICLSLTSCDRIKNLWLKYTMQDDTLAIGKIDGKSDYRYENNGLSKGNSSEALKPGQISPFFKTQNGLEIFRRNNPSPEPLIKVHNQVIGMIQYGNTQKRLEEAKRSMKIEINE